MRQPKKDRLRLNDGSCIRLRPERANHVWACDFVEHRTHDGRKLRMRCVVDAFTREALAILVKRRLNSSDVLEVPAEQMPARGTPSHIRSDDGPECDAAAVRAWLGNLGVNAVFIEPGSPWENGCVESFNSKLRDELLDGEIFHSLKEASILIEAWRRHHDTVRLSAGRRPRRRSPSARRPSGATRDRRSRWPPAPPSTSIQPACGLGGWPAVSACFKRKALGETKGPPRRPPTFRVGDRSVCTSTKGLCAITVKSSRSPLISLGGMGQLASTTTTTSGRLQMSIKKSEYDAPAGEAGSGKAVNRRTYLKGAAVVGAGALAAPAVVRASDVEHRLRMQSNFTGIGVQAQDEAARRFIERVNKMSGGRIEIQNFDAEVLLGIGETFSGVSLGVADLAITAAIYHRGTVPVGEFLWAVPFFPHTNVEFFDNVYENMGLKELWREAYAEHGVMHLGQNSSDEWGSMVSTRPVRSFSDFSGMKVRAFGIWADWMVKNGASIVTVPGGETYTAIQTKLIDAAAFGGPDTWAGFKIWEVCDYYINPSPCPYDVTETIMNMGKWNAMSEDLQEILLSAVRCYNLDIAGMTVETDGNGRKLLAENGVETLIIPDEELREAAEWCWQQFTAKAGTMPYIDRMIEIYAEAREKHARYYGPKQLPI